MQQFTVVKMQGQLLIKIVCSLKRSGASVLSLRRAQIQACMLNS
jgi:hypothetical protein